MKCADHKKTTEKLLKIYNDMYDYFGPRGWWPGDTDFEICVGAILTQSVAWKNVAKAINNLKDAGLMSLPGMYNCTVEDLEKHIVPTLYYRMKAKKLKAFVNHIMDNYEGNLSKMLSKNISLLRTELLNLYGIGPETADSIILYAAEKPIFVIDAYTRRIFSRLGFFKDDVSYDEMQHFFMSHLPEDVRLYNEYHALIVGIGNRFCSNKKPRCDNCPLMKSCLYA